MLSPLIRNSVLLHAMSPKECKCSSEKEKTLRKEREVGVILSAIICCSVYAWGGWQFCGRQEEACDLPVHYSAFPQLWPSALRTQDLQSVSEWAILLPKTSCLRDRCLAFTKGGGGSITSGKLFRVGLFAGPLFKE